MFTEACIPSMRQAFKQVELPTYFKCFSNPILYAVRLQKIQGLFAWLYKNIELLSWLKI